MTAASHPSLTPRQERTLLLTLAGIQFSHILDFMIIMPLGPILMESLHIDTHQFGLLVSAYTFTAAIAGVLSATYIDRFERKRLLLTQFTLFALATLACGIANSFWTLLLARSAAGAFGGVMGAMVQTMVADLIPFERRGRASGTIMSAFSLSTVAGVPISLFLANHFGWPAPFYFIGALSLGFLLLGGYQLPTLRGHLTPTQATEARRHPLSDMFAVLNDRNHLQAWGFMALVIFSGFTIIPYITVYMVTNVGVDQHDVPLIYLAGGCATLFTSRLIGKLADRYGKVRIYRAVALGSLLPLTAITHLPPVALWVVLLCTTSFFILVPGRMVPAMAIVTSAANPARRGTFMSMNSSVQSLASGTAAYIGGLIISKDNSGLIQHYSTSGYVAIAVSLCAIWLAGRIHLHGQPKH